MTDGEPDTGLAGAFCHTCGTMPTVHRRTLLASFVAGVGVSGLSVACTSTDTATRPPTGQDPPPPDPQLTDLADEQQLLDRYDATMAAHPDLTSRLTPLRAHHADHASALQRLLGSAAGGAVPSPVKRPPRRWIAGFGAARSLGAFGPDRPPAVLSRHRRPPTR